MLATQARFPEGLAELRAADALDPLNPVLSVARALYMAHQYDDSIQECGRMLRLHPDLHLAHLIMGGDWEQKGDFHKALEEFDRYFTAVRHKSYLPPNFYAYTYARMGQKNKARKMLPQMEHIPIGDGTPSAYDIALAYTGLEERDKALEWLTRALDNNGNVWWLKVEPRLDPLRGDPRFQELLKKINLTP
jgi:tetratricopeptide (TPR) repeat protein